METTTSWFASWFDSPYYNEGRVLDLACGKGRHSICLAAKDLDVVGVDLSPESIAHKVVIQKLVLKEEKTVGDIDFDLQRYVENGYIIKNIRFEYKGELYHFQERVRALSLEDFEGFLKGAGLEIEQTFGDFALNPFDREQSDRLILIVKPC